jgi:hypothetical protein
MNARDTGIGKVPQKRRKNSRVIFIWNHLEQMFTQRTSGRVQLLLTWFGEWHRRREKSSRRLRWTAKKDKLLQDSKEVDFDINGMFKIPLRKCIFALSTLA